ncbi:alpha/beta hydrolase [uncultured Meiothermus sp.]|jgi:alpha-beta hydrolase superfamily lysophospholipase|uniref:alpha/beta hydrolase n=1 Tax=uncultured Meiothermus sp. TaxID=157471 RepID=UPI002625BF1A|nr:alpha/beta hydrolase [uncultured Meiothermus sp.]
MQGQEGIFLSSDGLALFYRRWRPAASRAVLLLIHGFGEHSGRYASLVNHLVPQGYTLYALDLRGHGRSPGQRGHIRSWREYRNDLALFRHFVETQEPRLPPFLYGHSMGGLIVLDYLVQQPPGLRGAVVSGALLEPGESARPLLVAVARLLSRYWPSFSLRLGLDTKALSRDGAVVQAYVADPLVHGKASARWGTEVLQTIQSVKALAKNIRTPLLILHGEADAINRVEGARWLFKEMPFTDKELRVYPGGFHEPHNDLDKAQVLQDVEEWLERHL